VPRESESLARQLVGARSGRSGFRPRAGGGEVRAEVRDDGGKSPRKAVELAARHLSEERTRERSVVALELGCKPFPIYGEGHKRCSPVGRMRLPRYEAAPDERVHEPGDRPRRQLQRFGKDTLGHRPALADLPEQMGAGRREVESLDRLRHVVVQQDDELEDTIEHVFILM
jgi:hypothetical protein